MLYIVSTPIGNLEDITFRAVRILKEVDLIAAEDTRHSGILLKHFEIETKMESYHSHSSDSKIQKIIKELLNGKKVALISDAGTPGISDPGFTLIQEALKSNIEVISIPGPAAFLTALSVSGMPMDKFLYLGFPPIKKGRKTMFESLKDSKYTTILYESPHRILKTLSQLSEYLGKDRHISVCRELTKMHEQVVRGTLESAVKHFTEHKPKGEFVLVIGPKGF